MQITIIKEDNFVSIDGVQKEMDCSFLPDDFHALQFDGSKGSVESSDNQATLTYEQLTAKIYSSGIMWIVEHSNQRIETQSVFDAVDYLNDLMFEMNDTKTGKGFFKQVLEWGEK